MVAFKGFQYTEEIGRLMWNAGSSGPNAGYGFPDAGWPVPMLIYHTGE